MAGSGTDGPGRHPDRSVDLTSTATPLAQEDFLVVDIERFQGPLDLLLHLIRQQDIDILEIPISLITRQFLAAVKSIEAKDLDNAGEFLEMAASLIRIKAQMLLPRHGASEDEDPRVELVRRLLEYEQIREISERLATSEAERARRFGKGFLEARVRPPMEETELETTWEEVFSAALEVTVPEPGIRAHLVTTRLVAMDDKMNLILGTLDRVRRIEFSRLVKPFRNRMHGVMTFLAGLELTRRRRVKLRQVRPFAELWVYRGLGEADESDGWSDPEGDEDSLGATDQGSQGQGDDS
jgi:segregation and condensation protein A